MIAFKNGIYQGQLQQGKKEGIGIFWWPQGAIYIGEWHNDMIHGEGIILLEETILRAQFKNNKFHGLCVNYTLGEFYHYEYGQLNGKCLKGQIVSQYRRGELISIDVNSDEADILLDEFQNRLLDLEEILDRNKCSSIGITESYLGKMKRNKQFGLGVENMFTNERRIGIFNQEQINNIGQIWKNGDIYTGEIKNNKFHGLGCYWIENDQKIISGIFQDGKCIEIKYSRKTNIDTYKVITEQTYQQIQTQHIQQRISIPYYQKCIFEMSITTSQNSMSYIPTQERIPTNEQDHTILEVELDIQEEINKIKSDEQTNEAKRILYEVVSQFQDKRKTEQQNKELQQPSSNKLSSVDTSDQENNIPEQLQNNKSKFLSTHSQQTEYFHLNDSKSPSSHSKQRKQFRIINQFQQSDIKIQDTHRSQGIVIINQKSDPYGQVLSARR